MLAPVALFIYNRPDHTRRTLESLRACPELAASPLYVYCDGAKRPDGAAAVGAARDVARELAPDAIFIEREHNFGLAASIIEGVTATVAKHGTVIVVEDDLEVGPAFLRFLNAGLARYAEDERVMQISGYQYPLARPSSAPCFLSISTSLGWATWQRAWRHFDPAATAYARLRADRGRRRAFDLDGAYPYFQLLEHQLRGEVDSWAIRWYLSVFERGGLVLYPPRSLVKHTGDDGSGTHSFRGQSEADVASSFDPSGALPEVALDRAAQRGVADTIRRVSRRSLTARALMAIDLWSRRIVASPRTPAPVRRLGTRARELARGWRLQWIRRRA